MKIDKWVVILIISVIIIGVVVTLGILNNWFTQKNPLEIKGGEGSLKTDSNGNVSTEYTRIAKFAKDNLAGWNWNLTEGAYWAQLIQQLFPLNDNELRQVVNEYDRMYSESLRSLIIGEYTGCLDVSWYVNSQNDPCYKLAVVIQRLNNLNA